jgi:hypothetical protein
MDAKNAPVRTFNYPGEHRFVNGLWQVGERTPSIQKAVPGTSSRQGMARHTRSRWHAHPPLLGTRRLLITCGRANGVLGCFPHMNVSMPSAHSTRGQQRGGRKSNMRPLGTAHQPPIQAVHIAIAFVLTRLALHSGEPLPEGSGVELGRVSRIQGQHRHLQEDTTRAAAGCPTITANSTSDNTSQRTYHERRVNRLLQPAVPPATNKQMSRSADNKVGPHLCHA